MAFLSAYRDTFPVENYNPPPGYYIGNDPKEQTALQFSLPQSSSNTNQQGTTFAKTKRFQESDPEKYSSIISKSNKVGNIDYEYQNQFGFDKIARVNGSKEKLIQQNLSKNNFVQQSQKIMRRKTVSHKQTAQNLLIQMSKFLSSQPLGSSYEGSRIQNKQQILIDHLNNLQNQQPGPGSYNSSYNLVKPKAKGFAMYPEDNKQENSEQPKAEDLIQLVWGRGFQTVYNDTKLKQLTEDEHKKSDSLDNFEIERDSHTKPSFLRMHQVKHKKTIENINSEFNLELLLHRERALPKQQLVPPPGWYYSEEKFSQFGKLKEKSYQNQCFDSRQPRFTRESQNNYKPGPGEYELDEGMKPKDFVISLSSKVAKINENPGVGQYEVKRNLLQKPQTSSKQAYPAIFGSGSRRDENTKASTPGPGAYNLVRKIKKPKFTTRQTSNHIRQPQQVGPQVIFGLSVNSEDLGQGVEVKNRQKEQKKILLQKQQKQHMFTSEVKRFIPINNVVSEEIGPGVYEVSQDIRRKTFNVTDQNFSQDARKCDLNQNKIQTLKIVGPGSYELTGNPVRDKKIQDIIIK